ncbi:hypothetical protein [Enterovirga sp. CN4-39]|uniref:hypothetical protein n=1 Tax=Enterovirga sp. CN4-39 TaxID=3400910 RepID=UPI003C0ECBA2
MIEAPVAGHGPAEHSPETADEILADVAVRLETAAIGRDVSQNVMRACAIVLDAQALDMTRASPAAIDRAAAAFLTAIQPVTAHLEPGTDLFDFAFRRGAELVRMFGNSAPGPFTTDEAIDFDNRCDALVAIASRLSMFAAIRRIGDREAARGREAFPPSNATFH